jgi:hypothetical protein
MTRDWPTREEWAEHHRTFYFDMEDGVLVSSKAADYGTPAEIDAAAAAALALRSRLLADLRQAKQVAGGLLRQPGESSRDYIARYLAAGQDDERDRRLSAVHLIVDRRRALLRFAKHLRAGSIMWDGRYGDGQLPPEAALLVGRREAAYQAAVDALRQQIETRPVDDAAWAKELERRQKLEAFFRDGPVVSRGGSRQMSHSSADL